MDGVQLPQGYRVFMRRQLTFYHYVPGIAKAKLIELGATQWFWNDRMIG